MSGSSSLRSGLPLFGGCRGRSSGGERRSLIPLPPLQQLVLLSQPLHLLREVVTARSGGGSGLLRREAFGGELLPLRRRRSRRRRRGRRASHSTEKLVLVGGGRRRRGRREVHRRECRRRRRQVGKRRHGARRDPAGEQRGDGSEGPLRARGPGREAGGEESPGVPLGHVAFFVVVVEILMFSRFFFE